MGHAVPTPPSVVPNLKSFTPEAETTAIVTAMTAAGFTPTRQRIYSINRLVRRLKDCGAWAKLTALYLGPADGQAASLINWKAPGTNNLVVHGSPTYAAAFGWTGPTTADYLDTGITLQSLSTGNAMLMYYSRTRSSIQAFDMGAQDSASKGFTLGALLTAPASLGGRAFSSTVGAGASTEYNGSGVLALDLSGGNAVNCYQNGRLVASTTQAPTAAASNPTIQLLSAAGAATPPQRQMAAAAVGQSLTAKQHEILACTVRMYADNVRFGDVFVSEFGSAPSANSYEMIAYGATLQSFCFAYEAARRGYKVAIVGGWNDYGIEDIGGMSTNGLSYIDIRDSTAIGGLPRWLITLVNTLNSASDTVQWQSRTLSFILRGLMDPARTNGKSIDYFVTGGVKAVERTGDTILSITTADGRRFFATDWHDGSYEGDLCTAAGLPYIDISEGAGASSEAIGGFRGTLTASNSGNAQFSVATVRKDVNPYIDPADKTKGLLRGVRPMSALRAVGAPIEDVQAYNFRLQVMKELPSGVPFDTTPPKYYDKNAFEPLMRLMGANNTYGVSDLLGINTTFLWTDAGAVGDANSGTGGMSTDYVIGAGSYARAGGYAEREIVRQKHRDWIRGLFYRLLADSDFSVTGAAVQAGGSGYVVGEIVYVGVGLTDFPVSLKVLTLSGSAIATVAVMGAGPYQASPSNPVAQSYSTGAGTGATFNLTIASRVPAGLATAINAYRYQATHHLDPHPQDQPWFPGQMYVRSYKRFLGDLVWDANDITATDGTTPRSVKTISCASYEMDRHHRAMYEDINPANGVPRIWCEGNVQATGSGGTNLRSPLPLEIHVPRRRDVGNLSFSFCTSTSDLAFSATRMELTAAQAGQSLAVAHHVRRQSGGPIQDVDYPTVRTAILAAGDPVAPVLPQVN